MCHAQCGDKAAMRSVVINVSCSVWWYMCYVQCVNKDPAVYQPSQANPISLCSTCVACYWRKEQNYSSLYFLTFQNFVYLNVKASPETCNSLKLELKCRETVVTYLKILFSFQNVIEKLGPAMMNLSEYIRFKSVPYELVYHRLWHILQFLNSDCMKIKQNGYRNFVSWLVFLTCHFRRQLYLEG